MLKAAVISLLVVSITGCASHDEVSRIASPDRMRDAVVVEGNGGATTSPWYNIQVTETSAAYDSGTRVASLYDAVRNESAYGVNLKWRTPTSLDVEYLSAKNASLDRPHPIVNGRRIEVSLRPGVLDPAAKAGGMLYNRKIGDTAQPTLANWLLRGKDFLTWVGGPVDLSEYSLLLRLPFLGARFGTMLLFAGFMALSASEFWDV